MDLPVVASHVSRRARQVMIPLAGLIGWLFGSAAQAQVVNLYPVTIGSRGFGFAGAYTALADDATAGWYNAAGLGFMDRTYINATANVYTYEHATANDYFSMAPSTGVSASAPLDEKQYRTTPTTFAVAKSLGSAGTLGFGVYVPRDLALNDSLSADGTDTTYANQLGPLTDSLFLSNAYTERSIYFGPSYGMRVNDNLSLGATAFVLDSLVHQGVVVDMAALKSDGTNVASYTSVSDTRVTYWGMRLAVGAKGRLGRLRLGFNVSAPTLRLSETTELTSISSQSSDITAAPGGRQRQVSSKGTSDTGRGWELAAGAGWADEGHWAAEADVTYYVPEFTRDIADRNVPNVQLGGEYYLTPNYLVRAGFFTDFSAQPGISNPPGPNDPAYHVDIYGSTVQLVYQDRIPNTRVTRSFSMGFRYAFGSGSAQGLVANPTTGDVTDVKRSLDYTSVGIMLGGTLAY